MDEFLSRLSSPEVSEWIAYFIVLAEESRPGSGPTQTASGDAALEVLRKHARRV